MKNLFFVLIVLCLIIPNINNSLAQNDLDDILPQGNFLNLVSGEIFFETRILNFEIPEAYSIEFYIQRTSSLQSNYLGKGIEENNIWQYKWDTTSLPNGNYFIYAQITNKYGTYQGEKKYISILNGEEEQQEYIRKLKEIEAKIGIKEEEIKREKAATIIIIETQLIKLKELDQEISEIEINEKIENISHNIDEIKKIHNYQKNKESVEKSLTTINNLEKLIQEKENHIILNEIIKIIKDNLEIISLLLEAEENIKEEETIDFWFIHRDPRKITPFNQNKIILEKIEITPENKLLLSGKSIPNNYITIHIFSSPIILTTRINEKGQWEIILDKQIPDGQHTVYASVTNEKENLLAHSDAFVFIKSGNQITLISDKEGSITHPLETVQKSFFWLIFSLIFFSFFIALFVIGKIVIKKP